MKYQKNLDSLRAVTVFLVLVWHFLPRPETRFYSVLETLFVPSGNFAVVLFFVLSGYLITGILLNDKSRFSNGYLVVRNFLIRRILRIFPIYFILLTVLVLLKYPFLGNELIYQGTFTSNFYVFQYGWTNYSHTWSLAVEEQFYLLWPWLLIFIPNRFHTAVFFTIILVSLASSIYFGLPGDIMFSSPKTALTTTNLAAFAIGGIYASQISSVNGEALIRKWIWPLALFSLGLIYYWKFCVSLGLPVIVPYLRILAISLVSIGVIHGLLNFGQGHLFEYRWLMGTGKISYGIYLYHLPLVRLFYGSLMPAAANMGVPDNPFLWFPFFCLTVVGLSFLSYRLIEKPFLDQKKRFRITENTE